MADFNKIIKEHGGDLSDTAINAIASAIKTAVGNEYVEKERYKAKLNEIDNLKEQAQTAEDKATTAGKWEDKYNELKKDFESYKDKAHQAEIKAAKEKAYRNALKDSNLNEKGIEKAVKYAEWDKIEVDDDGNLKDAKDHIKSAKEEWAEYVVKKSTRGADTSTPPGGNGGGSTLTKEEIYKKDDKGRYIMSTQERQAALAKMMAEAD